jgi:hypothetical protein
MQIYLEKSRHSRGFITFETVSQPMKRVFCLGDRAK